MKNLIASSTALAIGLVASQVQAADMAVKAAPIAAPVDSWTGCYVGGNAGWVGTDNRYNTAPSGSYLNAPGAAAPPNLAGTGDFAVNIPLLTHSYTGHSSGGLIGAQIGCNKQAGQFVFGVEADWAWSSAKNTVDAAYAAFPDAGRPTFTIPAHTEHVSSKLQSLGTFRGRAGFTWDRFYFYGTGGLAVGDMRSDTTIAFGTEAVRPVYNGVLHVGSESQIRVGWVVGAGGEYAVSPNWSIKAEYLYVDLGTHSYNSPLTAAAAPAAVGPGYNWRTSVCDRENIARVGLNYRFYSEAPLVANY